MSVCPFVALSKEKFAENVHIILSSIKIKINHIEPLVCLRLRKKERTKAKKRKKEKEEERKYTNEKYHCKLIVLTDPIA